MKTKSILRTFVVVFLTTITVNQLKSQSWNSTSGGYYLSPTSSNLSLGTSSSAGEYKLKVVSNYNYSALKLEAHDGFGVNSSCYIGYAGYFSTDYGVGGYFTCSSGPALVTGTGNVGIGNSSPSKKLDVTGDIRSSATIYASGGNSTQWNKINNFSFDVGGQNIGINCNPTPYTLAIGGDLGVNGKIEAEEIEVKTLNFADYVFDKDYKLRSLKEVEEYIDEHQHLPNIPSAKEVIEEGLNLGDMNVLMMEKIEELTLYTIKQNKQIEGLYKLVEELKAENENLKK